MGLLRRSVERLNDLIEETAEAVVEPRHFRGLNHRDPPPERIRVDPLWPSSLQLCAGASRHVLMVMRHQPQEVLGLEAVQPLQINAACCKGAWKIAERGQRGAIILRHGQDLLAMQQEKKL